jgi:hypothetical protein
MLQAANRVAPSGVPQGAAVAVAIGLGIIAGSAALAWWLVR